MEICKVDGCNNEIHYKKGKNGGYCCKHYMQIRQNGKILKRTERDKNEIIDCGDYCEICLYQKNKEIARTKIDKEDLEKIENYKWCLSKIGYTAGVINKKLIYLHQFILSKKQKFDIDHINRDKLDNRKQNLRHCTRSQNCINRKISGITWHKGVNKWRARITINYKEIRLGCFKYKQDAINVRINAEKQYFKKFKIIH